MANLLFKKGSYENFVNNVLNGNKAVEGTLYFTEDEGGLYVGQTGGVAKRIQGSVLYFESLQEFTDKVKPPYSSEVIYFIANNNALVRWREDSSLDHGGEWKILNFTYDDGVLLTGRVEVLESGLSDINTALGDYTLTTDFLSVTGTLETNLNKAIADIAANTSNISAANANITDHEGRLSIVEGTLPNLAEKSVLESGISDLQRQINTIGTSVGTHETSIKDIYGIIGNSTTEDTIWYEINDIKAALGGVGSDLGNYVLKKDFNNIIGTETLKDGTVIKNINSLKTDVAGIKTTIGTETLEGGSIIANVNKLKTEVSGINGTLPSLATKTELNSAVTTINGSISGINNSIGTETLEGGSIKKNINDLKSTVSSHTTTIGNHAETIDELIEADKDLKGQIDGLDEKLSEQIDTHIKAANALSYKGVITSLNNLPELNVSIGDTYVVGAGYAAGENDAYGPGDLLIAYGPENDDGFIPSDDLQWHHVDIGYNETFEPNLSISENVVQLKSHVNESLGSFTIAGSENVTVTTDATSNTITVGMVWGSF